MIHSVSINFYENGMVDVFEGFDRAIQFIHAGNSKQSKIFAGNVVYTLDKSGYAVDNSWPGMFVFTKEL